MGWLFLSQPSSIWEIYAFDILKMKPAGKTPATIPNLTPNRRPDKRRGKRKSERKLDSRLVTIVLKERKLMEDIRGSKKEFLNDDTELKPSGQSGVSALLPVAKAGRFPALFIHCWRWTNSKAFQSFEKTEGIWTGGQVIAGCRNVPQAAGTTLPPKRRGASFVRRFPSPSAPCRSR